MVSSRLTTMGEPEQGELEQGDLLDGAGSFCDRCELVSWARPFHDVFGEWLWERKARLPGMLVIVPTAQSGRRIRQNLADRGGVLAPRVRMPGYLLESGDSASDSIEILAWVELLEGVSDWSVFSGAFPNPPVGEGSGWALGLAKSLVEVRVSLLSVGLNIRQAASRMRGTVDHGRWEDLAVLEKEVERLLQGWEQTSRSRLAAEGTFRWDEGIEEVVIAGVPDLSPAVVKVLENCPRPVQVLVAGDDRADFDEWGRPLAQWAQREIAWPREGSVTLASDARDQAEKAVAKVAEGGRPSDEVAMGSADEGVTRELVRAFGEQGWPVYDPGRRRVPALVGWLSAWRAYLLRQGVSQVMDLLGFPGTGALVSGRRAQRAVALSRLRDQYLVRSREDLERARVEVEKQLESLGEEEGRVRSALTRTLSDMELSLETMESLEQSLQRFMRDGFHKGMVELLPYVDPEDEVAVGDWLEETADLASEVNRSHAFWLEFLLSCLGSQVVSAPQGRVLDIHGWLELFYEPGEHLVVCGLNEGKVPAHGSGNAWLPEATRRRLELPNKDSLAARDAYLLSAMLKARDAQGRVDLLLGKTSEPGDVLLPSRLLLAAEGQELARRVQKLFQKDPEVAEVAFGDENLEGWKQLGGGWERPLVHVPQSMRVTAFRDYLECPVRFYLSEFARMRRPDPERVEWSATDYGSVAHEILEKFGLSDEARDLSGRSEIADWMNEALTLLVADRFGSKPAAAIRIQADSLRERLGWFAETQAGLRDEGWRIERVEAAFSLDVEGMEIRGSIDRIDYNEESGTRRVLDYKTSAKATGIAKAHLTKITASTAWPEHLVGVDEVVTEIPSGRANPPKLVPHRWHNLQLPLYALGLAAQSVEVDEIGYFSLGASRDAVQVSLWPGFSEELRDSALACAQWVIARIKEPHLLPRSEKVKYEAFEELKTGKVFELLDL